MRDTIGNKRISRTLKQSFFHARPRGEKKTVRIVRFLFIVILFNRVPEYQLNGLRRPSGVELVQFIVQRFETDTEFVGSLNLVALMAGKSGIDCSHLHIS